jgi:general secretion pathway protein D
MILNNQKAKINVGDQVPIQTSTSSLPVASGTTPSIALGSSIQYKDTGVTLEVTPRVNANGMVIMDIKQLFSVPVLTTTGVATSPTIQKKEIESSIAVNDGETIVLGGLIDDTNNAVKSGFPILYELPWVGSLFGNTTYTRTKNELVILITPRVVKSKQDSRQISDEFKRKLTGIYQKVSKNNYDTSRSLE